MSKISIKVSIAGRDYPLTIRSEERDNVMRAAEMVNRKLEEYASSYAVSDKQDLLAMCALQFSTQYINSENEGQLFSQDLSDRIVEIEQFVSDYLKKDKALS
ncbi:MAG TPA: cell division protein ZapA [Bacteroidia bacterium]|jgi:cell division protein ZapA